MKVFRIGDGSLDVSLDLDGERDQEKYEGLGDNPGDIGRSKYEEVVRLA